ncbi:MAG: hypothetical protein Q4E54_03135 [Lachnospiraceae bacterium]|nr:hypothetical protein [Lachnospiraceae bacterium]
MKKIIALVLAIAMAVSVCTISFANQSRSRRSTAAITRAQTSINTKNKQEGTWTEAAGKRLCSLNGKQLRSTWALIYTPETKASQWYYFDADGVMLTGWVWIKSADGLARCYYLNPASGSTYGALFLDGMTPDYQHVDSTGAWSRNGVQQTRK